MQDKHKRVNTVIMNKQYKDRDFTDRPLIIGTRGSPLAVSQAEETKNRLMKAHKLDEKAFRIKIIKTTGDLVQDKPLSQIGGKGLFTKEIEEALLSKEIDIAVHSMKDVPTVLPKGLEITTLLPREDVRDSFLSNKASSIDALPIGCTVGTSSLRRKAQLLSRRPDLKIVEFRGNVQTRLRKLEKGVAQATFLACAGLKRLGLKDLIKPISVEQMLPAVAQGAIGLEQREEDEDVFEFLSPIHDLKTAIQLEAERAFLAELDGSCRTPIGGYAKISGQEMTFYGEILRPDGSKVHKNVWNGSSSNAFEIGKEAGKFLKEKGGNAFFD